MPRAIGRERRVDRILQVIRTTRQGVPAQIRIRRKQGATLETLLDVRVLRWIARQENRVAAHLEHIVGTRAKRNARFARAGTGTATRTGAAARACTRADAFSRARAGSNSRVATAVAPGTRTPSLTVRGTTRTRRCAR